MKCMKISALLVTVSLLASPSFAAQAPLPAGKPAGMQQAALLALGPIFWIGLAAAIAGIAAAASSGGKSSTTTGTGS